MFNNGPAKQTNLPSSSNKTTTKKHGNGQLFKAQSSITNNNTQSALAFNYTRSLAYC